MIHTSQWPQLTTKIMMIEGMDLTSNSSFQLDEAPTREQDYSHLRFTSDGGVADNFNGDVFTKYMRSIGISVDQRRPKLVIVKSSDILKVFG